MEQIEVFREYSPIDLEEAVNNWMRANHPVVILARQFSTSGETSPSSDSMVTCFSYCITYREIEG